MLPFTELSSPSDEALEKRVIFSRSQFKDIPPRIAAGFSERDAVGAASEDAMVRSSNGVGWLMELFWGGSPGLSPLRNCSQRSELRITGFSWHVFKKLLIIFVLWLTTLALKLPINLLLSKRGSSM